jgi:hypothetical protein
MITGRLPPGLRITFFRGSTLASDQMITSFQMTYPGRFNMLWEKLGGFLTIVIAIAALCFISIFDPPTFIQVACALLGSFVCLIGVVFLFAEKQIFTKGFRLKDYSGH